MAVQARKNVGCGAIVDRPKGGYDARYASSYEGPRHDDATLPRPLFALGGAAGCQYDDARVSKTRGGGGAYVQAMLASVGPGCEQGRSSGFICRCMSDEMDDVRIGGPGLERVELTVAMSDPSHLPVHRFR